MVDLIEHVLSQDVGSLRHKLADGVDPNEVDTFGYAALHFAALIGAKECTEALLGARANPKLQTLAMASGLLESRVVRPAGATFYIREAKHPRLPENVAFDKGSTPLHIAAWAGQLEIVELLLAAKAKQVKDGVGAMPLHLAALSGHAKVVERLLESSVAVDGVTKTRKSIVFFDKGMTALHAGLESGDIGVVRALLAAGASPEMTTDTGCTSVFFAARGGNVETLSTLGESFDPGGKYMNWPLVEAVEHGHAEMVTALLKRGALMESDQGQQAPLRCATERNDLCIRKILLDHGGRPLEHSQPRWAARANDVTALNEMARSGVDLSHPNDGSTPLMDATAQGHIAAVAALLDLGVDLDVVTSYSAAHVAISNGHGEILDMLLDAGVDCGVLDNDGNTPLFSLLFTRKATPQRIQRMMELGANPHRQNRTGSSPIKSARQAGLMDLAAVMESAPVPEDADALTYKTRTRSEVLDSADGSESWKELNTKLWDELVPPRNAASNVQGELLRCIGSLTDEAYRNGNINWGPHLVEMVDTLERFLLDGTLGEAREDKLKPSLRALKHYRRPDLSGDGSPHYLVNEAVVQWCLKNRELIPI